jgi:hypothetical protein
MMQVMAKEVIITIVTRKEQGRRKRVKKQNT